MEKIVVISFNEEVNISSKVHELTKLEHEGLIQVNEHIVVHKTVDGVLHYKNSDGNNAFTIAGGIIGGIFGLFAGPVGSLVGAEIGGVSGMLIDKQQHKKEDALLKAIMHSIPDKTVSIIAYLYEYNSTSIKNAFKSSHAKVFEYDMDGHWFNYNQEEIDELNNKMKSLQDEINAASDHDKSELKMDYERLKDKQHHLLQLENQKLAIQNKHLKRKNKKQAS